MSDAPALELDSPAIASRVRALPRALGWIGVASYLLPAWALTFYSLWSPLALELVPLFQMGVMTCLVSALLGFGLANRGGRPGRVLVDDHGITTEIGRETGHVIPPMIASAILVPASRGCRVELVLLDDTTLSIELSEQAQGEALLERIEQSKHAASMTIGMQTPTAVWMAMTTIIAWAGCFAASLLLYTTGGFPLFAFTLIPTIAALITLFLLASTHVVVGDDGIRIERILRRRFISFDAMRAVKDLGDGRLRITLNDGDEVNIGSRSAGHSYASALLERIERQKSPERGAAPAAMLLLTRGDKSTAGWREVLRGVLSAQPGYRGPRLSAEEVLDVVVDPARAVEHRVGAALALAESGALDAASRKRLRIAAEASADQRLRIVLQGAADDTLEDALIEDALEDARAAETSKS